MQSIKALVSSSIKRKAKRRQPEYQELSSTNSGEEESNNATLTADTKSKANNSNQSFENVENTIERAKALRQKMKDTQNQGELRIGELKTLKTKAMDGIEAIYERLISCLRTLKITTLEELDKHEKMQEQYIKDRLSSLSNMTESLDSRIKRLQEAKAGATDENFSKLEMELSTELKINDPEVDVIANGIMAVSLKVCTCKSPESILKSIRVLCAICTSEVHVCKSSSDTIIDQWLSMVNDADDAIEKHHVFNESVQQRSQNRKEQIRKIKEYLQQVLMLQSKEEQLHLEQLQQEHVRQKHIIQEQMHHKTIEKEKQRLIQLQKRQQESNEERLRKEKLRQEQLQKEIEHQEQIRQQSEEERRSKQGIIQEMLQEYAKQEDSRRDIVRQKHIRTEQSRQEQMKEEERLAKLRQSQQEEVREKQNRFKDMHQEQTQKEIERQRVIQQKQQLARQDYLKQSQEQQLKNEKVRQEQLQQERLRQERIRKEKIEQQKKEEEIRLKRESMIREEKAQKEKIRQEQLLQQKQQEEKIQEQKRHLRDQQIKSLKEDQMRQAELLKQLYRQIKEK